jgi:hypothetical protein
MPQGQQQYAGAQRKGAGCNNSLHVPDHSGFPADMHSRI